MTDNSVSVGRLKARLSEYIRRARAGETVLVTDRGTPVAQLAGLEGGPALEGRSIELVQSGMARAPKKTLDPELLRGARPRDPDGRSLETVLEERGEGW